MSEESLIDYRGDCWKGFKDVRARLRKMAPSHSFTFICDQKVADKIERVVTYADGVITSQEQHNGEYVISVMKS